VPAGYVRLEKLAAEGEWGSGSEGVAGAGGEAYGVRGYEAPGGENRNGGGRDLEGSIAGGASGAAGQLFLRWGSLAAGGAGDCPVAAGGWEWK